MKSNQWLAVLVAAAILTPAALVPCAEIPAVADSVNAPQSKAQILLIMEKMAAAQLAQPAYTNRAPADWVAGAFYVGLAQLSHVSDDPKFVDAQKRIADQNQWQFQLARNHPGQGHADDECAGQMYIDLAVRMNDLAKLEPMRKQLDGIIEGFEHPTDATRRAWDNNLERDKVSWPWWWCDSFFMAPPLFARLSLVTGDKKYIDEMNKQWWFTYDRLCDKEEHLFYRDSKYLTQKTANGKKVFWSRGNGWVIAGTANVLTYMPKDYPTRGKYEQLLKEMAAKLLTLQQPDGLWRMSLEDPAAAPNPETSGTAFFCYAFTWGINNGYLDRATYAPAVEKAWTALNQHILENGLLGAVQPVGEQPVGSATNLTTSQPYAVGAFLQAGCELIKLHESAPAAK